MRAKSGNRVRDRIETDELGKATRRCASVG
jgi:hypothetical protein